MIYFIICYSLLCFVSFKSDASPVAKLEKDSYDLGKLEENKIKDFQIPIFNKGTGSLEIEFATTSCGCVEIVSYDKTIAEGQKGNISIKVDPSKSGNGQKFQMIVFNTNDANSPHLPIKLYYRKALSEVAVSPKSIKISLSKSEIQSSTGGARNTITIADTWKERLIVKDVRTSSNIIVHFYDILYRCPTGAESHVLRFDTYLSPKLTPGDFKEWIAFDTNHPLYPTITIPITGNVQSDVKIQSKIVMIRNFPENQSSVTKTVAIETVNDGQLLEIEEIICSEPWVKVKPVKVSNGKINLVITVESPSSQSVYKDKKVIKSEIFVKIKKPDEIEKSIEVLLFF